MHRALRCVRATRRGLASLPKPGTPEYEALRLQEAREYVEAVHGGKKMPWFTIAFCSAGVGAVVLYDLCIQQPHDREIERRKRVAAGMPAETSPLPPGAKARLADGRYLMHDGSIQRKSN